MEVRATAVLCCSFFPACMLQPALVSVLQCSAHSWLLSVRAGSAGEVTRLKARIQELEAQLAAK